MSKPELALWATEGTGRAYKHPFRKLENGKPLTSPSITTVLKLENKDNLVQWAANLTLEWCIQNWFLLGQRSTEDALSAGRYRWKDVRDERAEVGTGIHETVEAEHTGSWAYPVLDEEQKEILELGWEELKKEWDIEPILTEFTVWNLTHDYAGTGDGIWRFTNKESGESFVALVDLKTSRNTWPGHWMQLAALANGEFLMVKGEDGTWTEEPMPDFDKVVIVHLRAPERNLDGVVTKEAKHDILYAEDLDIRFREFVAYRTIWAAEDELKARAKAREIASYGGFN